jgi:hypothetical protein
MGTSAHSNGGKDDAEDDGNGVLPFADVSIIADSGADCATVCRNSLSRCEDKMTMGHPLRA